MGRTNANSWPALATKSELSVSLFSTCTGARPTRYHRCPTRITNLAAAILALHLHPQGSGRSVDCAARRGLPTLFLDAGCRRCCPAGTPGRARVSGMGHLPTVLWWSVVALLGGLWVPAPGYGRRYRPFDWP